MREYELALIVHPRAEPELVTSIAETVTGIITEAGGEVHRVGQLADGSGNIVERPEGDWRKSKLAYPIQKQLEGYYLFFQTAVNPDILPTLERNLRLNESVIRHLFVRLDH
ncbi:MAG: 30S ribosomal protein S6 [Anaerolineae bacterium]